jgi:DNA transformation protein and related proteins
MGVSDGYLELLEDSLADLGPVTSRRMFGGAGLFAGGAMFALVVDDALYLKADDETRSAFEAESLTPFSYNRNGRTVALSYWRAPERLLDDRDEMLIWASRAMTVAKKTSARAAGTKRRKTP